MPGLEDIQAAAQRIQGRVHRTPVVTSTHLDQRLGARLHLKAELFQKTGSFKVRGALNRMLQLTRQQQRRGVVTMSSGNHAQAVAWAARELGVDATVVMPSTAPAAKLDATRGYGAHVLVEDDHASLFTRAQQIVDTEHRVLVHPFDDEAVIAGQGTVGLELIHDAPELDLVIVPVGGGGLIAGIATAVGGLSPHTRVIGVEPEGAAAMTQSLDQGSPQHLQAIDTIADGLAPPMAGAKAFQIVQKKVDRVVTVPDDAIRAATRRIMQRIKLVVEPSGAAGLAALESGAVPLEDDQAVGVVLSGGNLDLDRWPRLITKEAAAA